MPFLLAVCYDSYFGQAYILINFLCHCFSIILTYTAIVASKPAISLEHVLIFLNKLYIACHGMFDEVPSLLRKELYIYLENPDHVNSV